MSPRFPDPRQIENVLRQLFEPLGLSPDEVFDPFLVIKALDIEFLIHEHAIGPSAYIPKPWPTISVSREVAADNAVLRQTLIYGIACYVADKQGFIEHDVLIDIGMPVEDIAICRFVRCLEARMTIPIAPLMQLLQSGEPDNFVVANAFRTTLEITMWWLMDLVASDWPGVDKDAVNAALNRSRTRIELLVSDDLDRFVEIDPFIMPSPLLEATRNQVISLIAKNARPTNLGAGATVDVLIKREASADLQAMLNAMPLRVLRDIRNALLALAGGRGAIAFARFLNKVGHALPALRHLKTVAAFETRQLEAEAKTLEARIVRVLKPGLKGLRASEQLNREALKIDPTNVEARLSLVNDLADLGRPIDGLRELAKLQGKPEDTMARYYYAGKCYMRLRDFERATHAFLFLASQPGQAYGKRALSRQAQVYVELGNDRLAVRTWEQLLAMKPWDMKAVRSYVDYLMKTGRDAEAASHLARVSSCAPLQPYCASAFAELYERAGEADVAKMFRNESRLLATFWSRQHIHTTLEG